MTTQPRRPNLWPGPEHTRPRCMAMVRDYWNLPYHPCRRPAQAGSEYCWQHERTHR